MNHEPRQEWYERIRIRRLDETDPQMISDAFAHIGSVKPVGQYLQYLAEQAAETRVCLVVAVDGQFAGYVTVNWSPTYPGFAAAGFPEIQDLNVLPNFRRYVEEGAKVLLDDDFVLHLTRQLPDR